MADRARDRQRVSYDDGSLVDLLDRLLEAGVVVAGDAVIGLAGVDLIRLNVRALLASVTTLQSNSPAPPSPSRARSDRQPVSAPSAPLLPGAPPKTPPPATAVSRQATDAAFAPSPRPLPRLDADGDRGLARLVLALVELLRQLMERQALHRMDGGDLGTEEVERLGQALMALESRMADLREAFGLTREDLRLSLDGLVA